MDPSLCFMRFQQQIHAPCPRLVGNQTLNLAISTAVWPLQPSFRALITASATPEQSTAHIPPPHPSLTKPTTTNAAAFPTLPLPFFFWLSCSAPAFLQRTRPFQVARAPPPPPVQPGLFLLLLRLFLYLTWFVLLSTVLACGSTQPQPALLAQPPHTSCSLCFLPSRLFFMCIYFVVPVLVISIRHHL